MTDKPLINIDNVKMTSRQHGTSFAAEVCRIGPLIGLKSLGCTLHVVAPGKRAYPFHNHHMSDEMFIILSGEGSYRFGKQSYPVRASDVLGAPAGKIAHQLVNTGTEPLRYLAISTNGDSDVVEYPDSGKFAVAVGVPDGNYQNASFAHIGRTADNLDYWEGEPS
jgi:uncharacterized cupin superfamily protein